jgi:hypothetical protein
MQNCWIRSQHNKSTQAEKNQRYFKNPTRFSNIFTSMEGQCFLVTCNCIFCFVKYCEGVNHLQTGSLSSDTRQDKKTHTLVLYTSLHLQHFCYFYFKSLIFCSIRFSFEIQSAHCWSSSLVFATSMVNTLVISKTVQCTIHLVTNVAHRCLSWMGMNILNVAT